MLELMYITWNPDPTLVEIGGFALRWYSLFWVIALLAGSHVVYKLYELKKLPMETFQTLFMYSFVGILAGARLGHCLFYEPEYYLNHPLEIVLPVHFLPDGGWKFTGYAGLASHGGTLGLIVALVLFCRKTGIHCLDILDMMGIAAPVAAGFIRIANLMNSEIIGMPAQVPWAFVFERVDMQARHPAQLYEAIAYFVIFLLIGLVYKRYSSRCGKGFFFGLCLALIYAFRFFIEYIKERQVDFEASLPIDMGQILSIPLVAIGLYFVVGRFQWKQSGD